MWATADIFESVYWRTLFALEIIVLCYVHCIHVFFSDRFYLLYCSYYTTQYTNVLCLFQAAPAQKTPFPEMN